MHSKWVFKHFYLLTNKQIYVLAVIWVIGLLSGVFLCGYSDCDISGIFSGAVGVKPAPLVLFLVSMLPALLLLVAGVLSLFSITCVIVFLFAVFQGFCGIAIYIAVGSAAWLLRPMLLFSSSCASVLVWWLLLQSKQGRRIHKNIRIAFIFTCITFLVDLFLISPIVSNLATVFLEGFA